MDRYAMVLKVTMQLDRFVPVDNGCSDVYFIDMADHPQKDMVQEGWFYNPEDNTFYEEDYRPEPVVNQEPTHEEVTLATSVTTEYIACMMEINS